VGENGAKWGRVGEAKSTNYKAVDFGLEKWIRIIYSMFC